MTCLSAADYDPLLPVVQADPYPYYSILRREAPVTFVESLQAYAVSRHADVRRVINDSGTFSSRAMRDLVSRPRAYAAEANQLDAEERDSFPVSLIGIDGDEHARLRQIVSRAFTPKWISEIEQQIRAIADELLHPLIGHESFDLQAGFAVPLPTMVIAEMLGFPSEHRDEFRRWSEDMVRAVFEPIDDAQQAQVVRSGEQMAAWLDSVIKVRGKRPGDDLVSVLMQAETASGALTPEELQVFVFTLLVAGSITTAYLIGSAVQLLATDSTLVDRLASGHGMREFVEETIRFEAPTQMMFRTAMADSELSGQRIPTGSTIMALIGSANRDGQVFHDADQFVPGRERGAEHLTFGHGIHHCLGAALARLETTTALEELLKHVPRIDVVDKVEYVSSLVFRGPTRLVLQAG